MMQRWTLPRLMLLLLALSLVVPGALAQEAPDAFPALARGRFKSGDDTLVVLGPLAKTLRQSIVKLDVNGSTVALGAVIDASGLVLTKASELNPGRLTCWLAGGKEVEGESLAKDEDNDVALVKVKATGLKPIEWAEREAFVGQWAVTLGIEDAPQAIGIISVPPRRILPPRALIGVQFGDESASARIASVMSGYGAEKAGLKPGDTILAVNDAVITNRLDLINTVRQLREGQTVKLRVQRDEEQFEAEVALKAEPAIYRLDRRQDRMNRLGSELSVRAEGFERAIQHDTVLQSWQCGGPLVNLDGKVIGLNIARAGRVATYALPADLVKRVATNLMAQVAKSATLDQAQTKSSEAEPSLKQ
jgi:serine protease Do